MRNLGYLGEGSPIGYVNPKAIELLNAANSTMNPDERDQLYRKLNPILQADLPLTFLFPLIETHVAHRRLKGLSSPHRAEPVWYMEHLWIEDEE